MLDWLDWVWSWIPTLLTLIWGVPMLFWGWRLLKAFISAPDLAPGDAARELRLSQSRIRRLRTARYAAEHSAWSAEFSALGGGCSCHGSPAPRRSVSASRYVPYL